MRRTLTRSLSLLLGLGMVFIGLRFLLAPRAGAEGFGVFLPPANAQYAFHYAKGIRDVFSGLLLGLAASLFTTARPATAGGIQQRAQLTRHAS